MKCVKIKTKIELGYHYIEFIKKLKGKNMYTEVVTFHIIFAGIWLAFFIIELTLRKQIVKSNSHEKASLYLSFTNSLGTIGSIGILLSGIIMVMMNNHYGFFDMSGEHWLATKQMILVVILVLTGIMLIPNAKKVKLKLGEDQKVDDIPELRKIFLANQIINYLVLINFIFAVTHRLYG